jgi:hypothetical protein
VLLKDIMQRIERLSGLKVNYHKSCLVPINVDQDKAVELAGVFGYTVGSFPFTYLGLPMGTTKPQVKDYAPLIYRVERRMSASSLFLSYAGKLQLVNSVLSSLPTYYMCSLKLLVTVIEIIDKHRKNCLWRGRDFRNKGFNLEAWDLVRRPKSKGGLGVINLSLQNDALLLKQLDKFYRKANVQWVTLIWQSYYVDCVPYLAREKGSFWWKDILRLNVVFRGIASCVPGKGDTINFWEDLFHGSIRANHFPNLFAYAKDPKISLQKIRNSVDLIDCFRIPMSRQAYNELLEIQEELMDIPDSALLDDDSWKYIWGQQCYSSSKFYQYSFSNLHPSRVVVWIWATNCVPKIKFFAWLLLNDRLNTRNMLRRRNKFLEEGYNCALCQDGVEETVEHLFFDCSSAVCRWFALGIICNEFGNIHQRVYAAKQVFNYPFFMEVFLIGAWCIWKERNELVFNNKAPRLASWKPLFKSEVTEHLVRIKECYHHSISLWLQAL